ASLGQVLRDTAAADALNVTIDNLEGHSAELVTHSSEHQACRLFRRGRAHWVGRIHEQVKARAGEPPLVVARTPDVRITHTGYLRDVREARGKAERNVAIAEQALAAGPVGGDGAGAGGAGAD